MSLVGCIVVHLTMASRPRGYKTFFMINSVEHEILNAHKDKISRISAFVRLR